MKDHIALDYLTPLQRAQLIKFYPELAEDKDDNTTTSDKEIRSEAASRL